MTTPLDAEIAALGTPDEQSPVLDGVLVVGAGAMGAGIAAACARAGLRTTLTDVDDAALDRARVRLAGQWRREPDARWREEIELTTSLDGLAGVDLVIEAVVEDPAVKHAVLAEVCRRVGERAIVATNTSTLPITDLAVAVTAPQRFCGIHFFSPVDRMRLVELIPGHDTAAETVAGARALVHRLGKVPILAGDRRGFFASRVFARYIDEGIRMVTEGHPAEVVEEAGRRAGFPAPPLAMSDAVAISLSLATKVQEQHAVLAAGGEFEVGPAMRAMQTMVDLDRPGRAAGRGFYDYPEGAPKMLWSGLRDVFPPATGMPGADDLVDRLLVVMAVESLRCLAEGVIGSEAEANVGSVLGIGFPARTGGVLRFVRDHPGGTAGFEERAAELASAYGPRFRAPHGA